MRVLVHVLEAVALTAAVGGFIYLAYSSVSSGLL